MTNKKKASIIKFTDRIKASVTKLKDAILLHRNNTYRLNDLLNSSGRRFVNKFVIPPKKYSLRERFIFFFLEKSIRIHAKAHARRKPWGLSTRHLLNYPEGSLGKALGEFLDKENLEPIEKLERHDVFHILLGYETDFKQEAGLYFFLFGNGKKSFFAIGTILFSACLFPEHWPYLYHQYKRGKAYYPLVRIKFQEFLHDNYDDLKKIVRRQSVNNLELLNKLLKYR